MLINWQHLVILSGVVVTHLLLLIVSVQPNPRIDPDKNEVLQAQLISPAIPPLPPVVPEKPPKPLPKAAPPALTVAPAQKQAANKPLESKTQNPQKLPDEPAPPASAPNVAKATPPAPDPVTASSATSAPIIGMDGGSVALNQLEMVYRPDTEVFYPRLSKDIGEQGVVAVILFIKESGEVRSVAIERSSGFERLDKAAVALATRIRFKPYLINGVPSQVSAGISIKFQLNR